MANDYEFFKYYDLLLYYEEESRKKNLNDSFSSSCSIINEKWNDNLTTICKNFKMLYQNINLWKGQYHVDKPIIYEQYMNFWLNFKLVYIQNPMHEASNFFRIIKENDSSFFLDKFHINITDINKNDLEDMKKIYDLYQKYDDLERMNYDTEIKETCINEVDSCVNMYTELIKTCLHKDRRNFCTALSDFKDKYDKLKKIIRCITKDLPTLPSYKEEKSSSALLEKRDSAQITTQTQTSVLERSFPMPNETPPKNNTYAIIGSTLGTSVFLFGIYMFTPIGPWFRRNILKKRTHIADLQEESRKLLDIPHIQHKYQHKSPYSILYQSVEYS